MSLRDDAGNHPSEQFPGKKKAAPLAIWEVEVGTSGLSIRQWLTYVIGAWIGGGVLGALYWYVRDIQLHGEVTQQDIADWPWFAGVFLLSGSMISYAFFRYVLPKARRDLAKLQEQQARSEESTHSSTTPPEC